MKLLTINNKFIRIQPFFIIVDVLAFFGTMLLTLFVAMANSLDRQTKEAIHVRKE